MALGSQVRPQIGGIQKAEKIITPPVKKLQMGLLKTDVEVINLLPKQLAARKQSRETLSLSSFDDPHWSPRAQDIAAKLIIERLSRNPFVQTSPVS